MHTLRLSCFRPWEVVPPSEHFVCRVLFSSLGGGNFLPPSEPISSPVHISAHSPSGGLQLIFRRGIQSGSNEKQIEKFVGVKHKKVKQALQSILRKLHPKGSRRMLCAYICKSINQTGFSAEHQKSINKYRPYTHVKGRLCR